MRTWDLKGMSIVVGPYSVDGFDDGDVFVPARDEVSFTKQIGAMGEASRSKTNNRAGTITFRIKQTSPMNDKFSSIMISDELSNSGVVPFVGIDSGGTSVFVCPKIWLTKPPDANNARDAGPREWVFDAGDLSMFIGSSNAPA